MLARSDDPGPPSLAYVDLSAGTEIDRSWYRAGGMRASESHRVRFDRAPVLAVLGEPGELGREPWFSRDAIRTAAAWAGMADAAADAALADLAARGELDDLRALGAGRIVTARATIDRWLEHAAARADAEPEADLRALSVQLREAITVAARTILDEAARACGSRPFATGTRAGPRPPRPRAVRAPAPARSDGRPARPGGAGVRPRLHAGYFDDLYARDPDPWGFETSEYERAKYAATVDALDGRRYASALEIGCSIGVLTARLAERCDRLLAVDAAQAAADAARERLAGMPHVTVERRELPEDFPAGPFELIVCSEVLYYLDPPALEAMLDAIEREPSGSLLAVHWRPATQTYPLGGDEVHERLRARFGRPARSDRTPEYALDRFDVA